MIASRTNDNFKRWIELLSSRGIKKHSQFLIFGKKVIEEVMSSGSELLELILPQEGESLSPLTASGTSSLSVRETKGMRVTTISRELFKEIDIFGTNSPIAVARLPEIPEWESQANPNGLELLCPVGDPSNLGALLRSALAFGVSRVVLLKECAHPFHPKSIRALSSNPFLLPLTRGPSLKEVLESECKNMVALDMDGEDISKFKWPKDTRLILGEEGPGFSLGDNSPIRKTAGISRVKISISQNVESLNVMAAGSLAMFSYRQLHPAPSTN